MIEKLRSYGNIDETERNETYTELDELLCLEKTVHEEFEDLGRWSNYETKVYKIEENGETAYFEFGTELPATERQEGMALSWHFKEVFPKQIVSTAYVDTKPIEHWELKKLLREIELHDPSSFTFQPKKELKNNQEYYDYRNKLIDDAVYKAKKGGLKAGYLIHTPVTDIIEKGWDYRWGVVAYIELPTGQISWHIESPDIKYDGHTYEDKNARIKTFLLE